MEPVAKKMRTEDNSPERGRSRHIEEDGGFINCCGETTDDDVIVSLIILCNSSKSHHFNVCPCR